MLNSEIKYKISTNYKELYKLLKYDKLTIIGFIGISLNGVVNENYSKLIQMSYNQKNESFDIFFYKCMDIFLIYKLFKTKKTKTSLGLSKR